MLRKSTSDKYFIKCKKKYSISLSIWKKHKLNYLLFMRKCFVFGTEFFMFGDSNRVKGMSGSGLDSLSDDLPWLSCMYYILESLSWLSAADLGSY